MKCFVKATLFAVIFLVLTGNFGNGLKGGEKEMKIVFLHHSTGKIIWNGGVKNWFNSYSKENNKEYITETLAFPGRSPYGWNNYPYDYWNIWVKNAGMKKYMNEPTLEILTEKFDMIVFKHCFPVSKIVPCPEGGASVDSDVKCIENYKLQYNALKEKMLSFPKCKFLVWTGAALVKGATDEKCASRSREFFEWVRKEWDSPDDNIYIWNFFELETAGGLYMKDEYAESSANSHPTAGFAAMAAPILCRRIVDIFEEEADSTNVTGSNR